MKQKTSFTFIDLFAGIGGFRIALDSFGGECVFSSEIDKYCQDTYEKNFHYRPSGDIYSIPSKDIPDHDILCAGFPCQPFSISGKQLGFLDQRGVLFFEIIRIVKEKRPKVIFLENVANLTKHDDSKTINEMIHLLNENGYKVNYQVLNATDYEVAQSRKRVYFVCFRDDLNIDKFSFPKKHLKTKHVIDILDKNIDESLYIDKPVRFISNKDNIIQDKIVRIGTINKGGQGDRVYSPYGFGITLSAQGGGTASKTGAYLIDDKVRKLSINKCRKMQGFPDWFVANSNKNQAYKQFGNSVAVPVISEISKCFLTSLNMI